MGTGGIKDDAQFMSSENDDSALLQATKGNSATSANGENGATVKDMCAEMENECDQRCEGAYNVPVDTYCKGGCKFSKEFCITNQGNLSALQHALSVEHDQPSGAKAGGIKADAQITSSGNDASALLQATKGNSATSANGENDVTVKDMCAEMQN